MYGKNAEKWGHISVDLWGKKPLSGHIKSTYTKRRSRRILRHNDKIILTKEVVD